MPGSDEIADKYLGVIRGFNVRVYLEFDGDTKTEHEQCYSPEQVEAWYRNEWFFVGGVVEVSLLGIVLADASIWGMEYGTLPEIEGEVNPLDGEGDQFLNGYGPDKITEAIDEAEKVMARLIDERTKLLTMSIQVGATATGN